MSKKNNAQKNSARKNAAVNRKKNELQLLVNELFKYVTSFSLHMKLNDEWDAFVKISDYVSKIINVEKDFSKPLPVRKISKNFDSWLENNGAQFEGLKLAELSDYGCGLVATKDIESGEMILKIPRKLMMTVEDAESSHLNKLIQENTILQHMPNITLALFLLYERFKPQKSFWEPYFNVLPHSYPTVLYFNRSEMEGLRGSPAFEFAMKQYRHIARQYTYFKKVFEQSNDEASKVLRDIFTFEKYRWAVSTVMTRQNFVPSADEKRSVNAFIPMWDMCNHENGEPSTIYNAETKESQCVAWRKFSVGKQVFIFYGVRTNADFLVHNGFVAMDNKHDGIQLKLGISKADPLHDDKATILKELEIPPAGEFLVKTGNEPVDGQLLAFLRVFSMEKEHLSHWLENIERCSDLTHIDCALDTALEKKTWMFLLTRLTLLLKSYPTSLEEDLESLIDESLSTCQHNVLKLLICEKRIFNKCIEYAKQRIKV
ncbi:actin-histidine N-methyltransferase [Bemisia tabaci]|uniref:actin-histidine N-methyltransferase n=1 Tax=Bemisia tabaci TaxID=7038 RepID=UPI003B289F13